MKKTEKQKAATRAWRKANPEKVRKQAQAWAKANPEKIRGYDRKRRRANPEKRNATTRRWKEKNPEWARVLERTWRKANPEKVRAMGRAKRRANPEYEQARRQRRRASGTFKASDIRELFESQNGFCANPKCRTDLIFQGYHIDHRIPISRGGKSTKENSQLLCAPCNLAKGDKLPEDCGY